MEHFLSLLSTYGYWIIFPLMIIEGPIITVISSFLASLGVFNIYIIYPLAILGNVTGDIFYYYVGFFGRKKLLVKYGKYIGIDENKITYIENHYKKHLLKTIVIAKITEAPVILALVSAGIAKANFKRFFTISLLVEIPKVFIVVLIGYFFGKSYQVIDVYFKDFASVFFVIFAILIILFLIYKRLKR